MTTIVEPDGTVCMIPACDRCGRPTPFIVDGERGLCLTCAAYVTGGCQCAECRWADEQERLARWGAA